MSKRISLVIAIARKAGSSDALPRGGEAARCTSDPHARRCDVRPSAPLRNPMSSAFRLPMPRPEDGAARNHLLRHTITYQANRRAAPMPAKFEAAYRPVRLSAQGRATCPCQVRSESCRQRIRKTTKQCCPVATPCAAVHARECCRVCRGKLLKHHARVLCVREVVHPMTESLARPENVRLRDGRKISASLREQIAAQQRRGSFFRQETAFPRVRQVRRVEPTHGVLAQRRAALRRRAHGVADQRGR